MDRQPAFKFYYKPDDIWFLIFENGEVLTVPATENKIGIVVNRIPILLCLNKETENEKVVTA